MIILTSNLGSGGGPAKRFMGLAVGDEVEVSAGKANKRRVDESVRKHLRPELVNRLTKVVLFKPLGMETAREIFGKLMVLAARRHQHDLLRDAAATFAWSWMRTRWG